MKIRNGFVSNSSSSSFLIIFDKDNENGKLLLTMLNRNHNDYETYYDIIERKGETYIFGEMSYHDPVLELAINFRDNNDIEFFSGD